MRHKFKLGDKVVLTHKCFGVPKGTEGIVSAVSRLGSDIYIDTSDNRNLCVNAECLELSPKNKSFYKDMLIELENQIEEIRDIMDWMNKTGNDLYDPTEYKIWKAVEILESSKSRDEKTKVLTQIIKELR